MTCCLVGRAGKTDVFHTYPRKALLALDGHRGDGTGCEDGEDGDKDGVGKSVRTFFFLLSPKVSGNDSSMARPSDALEEVGGFFFALLSTCME